MSATHVPEGDSGSRDLRIAVLGKGAIGGPVAAAIKAGHVTGARLVAVVDSQGVTTPDDSPISLGELNRRADLVVEAAGQKVLAEIGPRVIAEGLDLLVLSIGAMADENLRRTLSSGPGRLYLSTGAIGGLDLLRAVADAGTLEQVTIATTKQPRTLLQDWMDDEQRAAILDSSGRTEVLRSTPQRVATAFPKSANVAMAVATAADDSAKVEAVVYADPTCTVTTHELSVRSSTGNYWFQIKNLPSPDNPATSSLVPFAVLRALQDLAGRRETLI
ncbi:aspartate dehydrogenase domain-containing protein [Demetria terragena]|uniref:aspartate dehydrogenase domain-containing protein n=1 Tax=Demetria terragena TaxID=63959 RepID=UPI00039A5218|nr:aspartate dehydrogenase domain-containing protein [Demetria terragena]